MARQEILDAQFHDGAMQIFIVYDDIIDNVRGG